MSHAMLSSMRESSSPLGSPKLTDGVIVIRPMTLDDAAAHLAGEDEIMQRFLSGGVSTMDTVTAFIEQSLEEWRNGGPDLMFGVRDATTDELIGTVESNVLSDTRVGVRNVTYGLHPRARGRGYATRAVRLVVQWMTDEGLADIAVIQCDPQNPASRFVAERAGFHYVGTRTSADNELLLTFVRRLSVR
jgi:RimJ/RimL family protein N-acetyltransferase